MLAVLDGHTPDDDISGCSGSMAEVSGIDLKESGAHGHEPEVLRSELNLRVVGRVELPGNP
jgi:hypothetical protein